MGLSADSFVHDDHGGAVAATEHLIGLGHKRIAFIGDTIELPTTSNRLIGYQHALEIAKIGDDASLVVMGASDRAGAAQVLDALMKLKSPPTALFLSNARISMVCVPVLQQLKLTDLSVIGFGDFPMADAVSPALTVIDQNPTDLGRQAVDRILERIDHPRRRQRRRNVLDVSLIERRSCYPATQSKSRRTNRTA